MEVYPAHIRIESDEQIVQSVQEHCRNTAKYAGESLKEVGLYCTAYLAGLLHDMGKFKVVFKEYLEASEKGNTRKGNVVNHTFAGGSFCSGTVSFVFKTI